MPIALPRSDFKLSVKAQCRFLLWSERLYALQVHEYGSCIILYSTFPNAPIDPSGGLDHIGNSGSCQDCHTHTGLPTESFPLLAMRFLPTDFLLALHRASAVHGRQATALPYRLPSDQPAPSALPSPPRLPFLESFPPSDQPASGTETPVVEEAAGWCYI